MHRLSAFAGARAIMMMAALILLAAGQGLAAEDGGPSAPQAKTAAYWIDQGGLYATYGNFQAAVNAFATALNLDPENAEAHFGLGLALGEMGDYANAMSSIDRAISLKPDEGRYYYGRGWILLLSGRSEEARPELMKAADLGSAEAQEYLQDRN